MLNKLKYNVEKNKHNVELKKPYNIDVKSANEFFSKTKLVYETDWQVCELEQFNEATSTTKGTLLPEKAKYDFSFELGIPESHLPFIRWNVIAKTVPEQIIQGVGAFIFTSLKEILLDVYQWKGVTQLSKYNGSDSRSGVFFPRSEPSSTVGPGWGSPIVIPNPTSAYETVDYVSSVRAISDLMQWYDVRRNEHGEYFVYSGGAWITYYQWTYNMSTHPWYDPVHGTTVWYKYGQEVNFIPDTWLYPPSDDDTVEWEFPNGTTDDTDRDSTPTYPNQYWDKKYPLKTFSWFLTTDGADWGYPGGATTEDKYDYTYDVFKEWYPGEKSIITTFDGGPPYHAYKPISENVIVTANQQEIINNLNPTNNNSFRYDIKGHMLLLSEANTEATYSDNDNPTYVPSGEDIQVKLKVYYDSKLNTKTIDKW